MTHNNPVSATVTGLVDLMRQRDELPPLSPTARLDGRTCLITGATSGLGRATAIELACRGAEMILASRSPDQAYIDAIRTEANSDRVRGLTVDLANLDSVSALCDRLRAQGPPIDVLVLNAGVMPRRSVRTPQGFELMFVVHFLANRLLVHRLLHDEVVLPSRGDRELAVPRIVFVTSNAHQSAAPPELDRLGEFVEYGLRDGLAYYAQSKLLLTTMACHLSRFLNPSTSVNVAVHSLCPGAVNSNLARDAPAWIKPLLRPVMRIAFNSPERAAVPLVHLACADWAAQESGIYLHMRRRRSVAQWAQDPAHGIDLWNASARLLRTYLDGPLSAPT